MKTVDELREAIRVVFAEWEKLPRLPSHWNVVGVSDTAHDRYTLNHINYKNDRYDSSLLAHLEIRDGKIWILTDNTEEGVATDLVREGVPKSLIVLGFYIPATREAGEFAVA
ncbi:MAG: XisI protein [Armatimonadetes bacterium]|nr:XisI protein [Armatimonadota bacterium]